MKSKLLNWLPRIGWVPHDIPEPSSNADPPSDTNSGLRTRHHSDHRVRFTLKDKSQKKNEKDADLFEQDQRFTPHRRKSTLSISSIADEELGSRTHSQGQSLLFARLPIEIRKIVYEYVMGEETVHLTLGARRRYGHFLCEDSMDGEEVEEMGSVDCRCKVLVGGRQSKQLEGTVLNLLKVCRRIYTEAIGHLYTPHTFALLHITHLLYLPTRFPAQRLDCIRSLRLRWAIRALPFLSRRISRTSSHRYTYPEDTANWVKGWRILSDMRGLRILKVIVNDPSPNQIWEGSWLSLEERLLGFVKLVKVGARHQNRQAQSGCFELWLPYDTCRTDWDMGDCGVVLRKPRVGNAEIE